MVGGGILFNDDSASCAPGIITGTRGGLVPVVWSNKFRRFRIFSPRCKYAGWGGVLRQVRTKLTKNL